MWWRYIIQVRYIRAVCKTFAQNEPLILKNVFQCKFFGNISSFFCSVSTLLAYLRHFDASADIYLGERYGYQLLSPNGFNYITGGGGIVFSLSVVEKLVKICRCPTASSPDDMIIALCLQRIGIEPIHSARFHQVRICLHFIAYFAKNMFYVFHFVNFSFKI